MIKHDLDKCLITYTADEGVWYIFAGSQDFNTFYHKCATGLIGVGYNIIENGEGLTCNKCWHLLPNTICSIMLLYLLDT
jgi:hypothetical protein